MGKFFVHSYSKMVHELQILWKDCWISPGAHSGPASSGSETEDGSVGPWRGAFTAARLANTAAVNGW